MRFAIFVGLMSIAIAIREPKEEIPNTLIVITMILLAMDITEFFNRLSKSK